MYKVIACDLDGTLLEHNKTISKENKQAIKEYRDKGYKFVIATGRGNNCLDNFVNELDINHLNDEYMIVLNGALVTDTNRNIIIEHPIEFDIVIKAFEIFKKFNAGFEIYTIDRCYSYNKSFYRKVFTKIVFKIDELTEDILYSLKDEKIYKMGVLSNNYDHLKQMEKELPQDFKDLVEITYSGSCYLEMNNKGVSKGQALLDLAEYLGYSKEETLAIGDSANDIKMIKMAGLGVAVKNAEPEVKKVAKYITKNDNMHSAVKEVIETLIK